ncbi:hypothetical protein [Parasphingorhabdus sp.]|uniref:hypothetical protein n=1 Tax=Parasphingorhabdus sp. TaxID=2709688 RepID=UPI0030020536
MQRMFNLALSSALVIGLTIFTSGCATTSQSANVTDCRDRVVGTAMARFKFTAKSKAKTDWSNKAGLNAPGYGLWKNAINKSVSATKTGKGKTKYTGTAAGTPCAKP